MWSVVRRQTQLFGRWCVVQFCILRCFFLTSQMSLALMAVERYVFICHGIHYLRLINTYNVHLSLGLLWLLSLGLLWLLSLGLLWLLSLGLLWLLSLGLLWLLSLAASVHGGVVLNQMKRGLQQQTSGFLCDAIKELLTFTLEEDLQVFVPPSVITSFCILAICYCYGCMYQAALRVSVALKCNNHRANCTVGLYLLVFLLQMAPSILFIVLTVMGNTKEEAHTLTHAPAPHDTPVHHRGVPPHPQPADKAAALLRVPSAVSVGGGLGGGGSPAAHGGAHVSGRRRPTGRELLPSSHTPAVTRRRSEDLKDLLVLLLHTGMRRDLFCVHT